MTAEERVVRSVLEREANPSLAVDAVALEVTAGSDACGVVLK